MKLAMQNNLQKLNSNRIAGFIRNNNQYNKLYSKIEYGKIIFLT